MKFSHALLGIALVSSVTSRFLARAGEGAGQQNVLNGRLSPINDDRRPHWGSEDIHALNGDRGVVGTWLEHSSAKRINTDAIMVQHLRERHSNASLYVVEPENYQAPADLLNFAYTGHASVKPLHEDSHVKWRSFSPPRRRLDGEAGSIAENIKYAEYSYTWKDETVLLYIVDGRDGADTFGAVTLQYIVGASEDWINNIIKASVEFALALHEEIWIYDGGYWAKSKELYESVKKTTWDNVILDPDMKKSLQQDVNRFFDSRDRYEKLQVPWKRGIIYYGPPGNGKTISIKSVMNMLDHRSDPIPSLYVRSLFSYSGPEDSIKQIFNKARQNAPCLLIFEDLDSLIDDDVRSYFLNEVDGLNTNDGVLMIGSTNHLDRLDPGISKRPSRFDRKYSFPKPGYDERVEYCEYWRQKLKGNEDVEFPHALSKAVADITDEFSFAYIQEAFVASLLAIAAKDEEKENAGESASAFGGKDKLDGLVLWREMQKQVRILRDEM